MTVRDYLAAVRQRADAATDGPWEAYDSNEETDYRPLWSVANDAFHNPPADEDAPWIAADVQVGDRADAEFIAAARSDVPRLVAALTAALDLRLALDDPIRRESKDMEVGYRAALTDLREVIADALTPKEND